MNRTALRSEDKKWWIGEGRRRLQAETETANYFLSHSYMLLRLKIQGLIKQTSIRIDTKTRRLQRVNFYKLADLYQICLKAITWHNRQCVSKQERGNIKNKQIITIIILQDKFAVWNCQILIIPRTPLHWNQLSKTIRIWLIVYDLLTF